MRFPGFTDEWKKITLGEIADVTKLAGYEFTKYVIYEDEGEIIALRGLNCKSGQLVLDDVKYIDHSDLSKLTRSKLYIGDILFTYVGTVGEVAIIDKNDKYYLAPNVSRIRLRPGNCEGFVMQQLSSKKFYNSIVFPLIATSSQPALSMENVRKFVISIPSIKEQNKIAQLLSIIDERIATQNKIIEDLKKLKSAIIDIVIGKSDFPKIRFEEIYDRAGEGGTPATSTQEYYLNGKIPFVKIEDLANKYLVSSKDFITELGLCKSSTWVVPTNSIIYSNGATIGAISINKIPVCTKQGILGIVPKEKYHVEYLYYLMTTTYFRKQIERIVTEGTMRTAYLKDINHIECPIPDLETQKKIASMLRNLSNKLELEQSILTNHTNQKRFVLSSMFI